MWVCVSRREAVDAVLGKGLGCEVFVDGVDFGCRGVGELLIYV